MIFIDMNLLYVALALLGFVGFSISSIIFQKKQAKKTFTCPLKADCHTVVHSGYSKFFGIPLEYMGFSYYTLIMVGYVLAFTTNIGSSHLFVFLLSGASLLSFLFSLYLTAVQGFILKEWCTWCLFSAATAGAILIITFVASSFSPVDLLVQYGQVIQIINVLSFGLGLGAATIADVLFFNFLRDGKISYGEGKVLNLIAQIVWVALGGIVLTDIGVFFANNINLSEDPAFLLRIIITGIIIINSFLLKTIISPKIMHISFGKAHKHREGELRYLRKFAFLFSVISVVSWYWVFVLVVVPLQNVRFIYMLGAYLVVVLVASVISQLLERHFVKKPKAPTSEA
jgi:uncharacterized membrane protein